MVCKSEKSYLQTRRGLQIPIYSNQFAGVSGPALEQPQPAESDVGSQDLSSSFFNVEHIITSNYKHSYPEPRIYFRFECVFDTKAMPTPVRAPQPASPCVAYPVQQGSEKMDCTLFFGGAGKHHPRPCGVQFAFEFQGIHVGHPS